MLESYCKNIVSKTFEQFIQYCSFEGYVFDVDENEMFSTVMGKEIEFRNCYWYVKATEDRYYLKEYKHKQGDVFTAIGKNSVDLGVAKCKQIGLCKFFISENEKKIYCKSINKQLFFIKRGSGENRNRYNGYVCVA